MISPLRVFGVAAVCALCTTSAALAQTTPPPSTSSDTTTRPATTTFFGDTGLWFVPTAEVLAHGKWSASAYRRGTNWVEGFTNVSDIAGTFAVGIGDRAEIFGSFLFDTRIDRDVRPLFVSDPQFGGVVDRYPQVRTGWTGDNVGDLYIGAKINLLSQFRQNPTAVAIRGMVKAPTGKHDISTSTGKPDVSFDLVVSRETMKHVELSGFAGYEFRGKPDNFDAPSGAFRWGAGAGFPTRSPLRGTLELDGLVPNKGSATLTPPLIIGTDGSLSPLFSSTENITRATAALTWQHRSGFFIGGGVSLNFPMKERPAGVESDESKLQDFADWQIRIGYHPGVRVYTPPAPPPPPTPPPAPAPQNRPPTVKARCEPCTVFVGQTSTVTADANDPDGDPLTYRWTAPTGTFQNPAVRQTIWTAPQQIGPVPTTVTVDDGHGGTASDSVTIQVIRPPTPEVVLTFEDVYFDFDRSSLRPEALRLLDDAAAKLQASPGKNIIIEGHTCSIGTAEYNLALGERRASSVKSYLLSRGVPADRLETRSYGEERPKFDNAREETRRLNRRAALVVKVQ